MEGMPSTRCSSSSGAGPFIFTIGVGATHAHRHRSDRPCVPCGGRSVASWGCCRRRFARRGGLEVPRVPTVAEDLQATAGQQSRSRALVADVGVESISWGNGIWMLPSISPHIQGRVEGLGFLRHRTTSPPWGRTDHGSTRDQSERLRDKTDSLMRHDLCRWSVGSVDPVPENVIGHLQGKAVPVQKLA